MRLPRCGSSPSVNREGGLVFFDVEWFGVPIAGQPCGKLIGGVQQPRIASLGGKQDKLADGDNAPIVLSGPAQNIANFVGEAKLIDGSAGNLRPLALDRALPLRDKALRGLMGVLPT